MNGYPSEEIQSIIRRLSRAQNQTLGLDLTHRITLKQSAVMIPILQHEGEAQVLLTVRPGNMSSHAGQVCFPGGRHDQEHDEDFLATALRESQEEAGIVPNNVQFASEFGFLDTLSGFRIFPYLAMVDQPADSLVFNPSEVEAHFWMPLKKALSISTYQVEVRNIHGISLPTYSVNYEGHHIWGATALILRTMAKYSDDLK